MSLEYDAAAREAARSGWSRYLKASADAKRCKIMRQALVSVTCCNDVFEAAAVANKALIDEAQQEPQ